MKIEYAIFDFDGTLFDSMFVWEHAGEHCLRSLGKEPKLSLQDEVRTMSLYQAAYHIKKEYNLQLTSEEIMDAVNRTVEHFYIHEVLPKPGVVEFLKLLKKKGIRMCIATATDRYQITKALERCGMSHYFEEIFTCSEVGHGKDEPVIFRRALEYFGADRDNTVVFEDAIHAVKTAKDDGFTVAAVFDSSEKRQCEIRSMSDYYFEDFNNTEDFRSLFYEE